MGIRVPVGTAADKVGPRILPRIERRTLPRSDRIEGEHVAQSPEPKEVLVTMNLSRAAKKFRAQVPAPPKPAGAQKPAEAPPPPPVAAPVPEPVAETVEPEPE